MSEVTLGGERLGSGNKQKQYLRNYERSTHDLSYIWRSTMAAGTLVPFMKELALPGDTFDINLNCDILTHPTIGPLFGSYKVQLDVFQVPIRLYQAQLHMNQLGIGLDMKNVKLPLIEVHARALRYDEPIDNQQVNGSHLLSYLDIRGLGHHNITNGPVRRRFSAVPYLAYFDIYKNYYANKQENVGAIIHKTFDAEETTIIDAKITTSGIDYEIPVVTGDTKEVPLKYGSVFFANCADLTDNFNPEFLIFHCVNEDSEPYNERANAIFTKWYINTDDNTLIGTVPVYPYEGYKLRIDYCEYDPGEPQARDVEPKVVTFPLTNIDDMRMSVLQHNPETPFIIDNVSPSPYYLPIAVTTVGEEIFYSPEYAQDGLLIKTYQSDLFNNWISTEWIDGDNGVSTITAVDTSGGSFTIDELMLQRKIYDMLMRIAVSGGTYDDWLDSVYTHDRVRSAENPMYIGGLIRNLVFQEVVSNSATEDKPLGTLAGRGKLGNKNKGGHIIAKVDEPSYLIGIISLTPYIDYSQGNKWDVNLETLDDLHKPGLDQIGFQDLITDQMAWWDTEIQDGAGGPVNVYKSAGKQPAWINYMTNVNQVKGNFADSTQQSYMVLLRDYEIHWTDSNNPTIRDLTTYIDPAKFNYIFADTRRDAQNFWAQIAVDITSRRKMSAKTIPNL